MKKEEFVKWLLPAVQDCEIAIEFSIAQAALESGWGEHVIGNFNIFGVSRGSWKGPVILVLTTEYYNSENVKFALPERIKSIDKTTNGLYKYRVYRAFRDYASLKEAITDHENMFKKPGYSDAWPHRKNAELFAKKITDSEGLRYATDPVYSDSLIRVIKIVSEILTTV